MMSLYSEFMEIHWTGNYYIALTLDGANNSISLSSIPWWRHQMETFSALLALCAGNSPVTAEFPSQMPVTQSIGVFFDLVLNKRLSKQSWGWWSETPSCLLWHHFNTLIYSNWFPQFMMKLEVFYVCFCHWFISNLWVSATRWTYVFLALTHQHMVHSQKFRYNTIECNTPHHKTQLRNDSTKRNNVLNFSPVMLFARLHQSSKCLFDTHYVQILHKIRV